MDVQLPAQPVDQSRLAEQRPLETQDGRPAGQGEEAATSHGCFKTQAEKCGI